MEIKSIQFRQLRNGEFLQFVKNIVSILGQADLVTLLLAAKAKFFIDSVLALDEVFKPLEGEELTTDLKMLDSRRDRALMGIKTFLQALLYREEPEIVAAADKLLEKYESYDSRIDKLPYQQETAVVNAFIKDINDETGLSEAVSTVNLKQWFDLLGELNMAFDKTYVDRAKTIVPSAKIKEKRIAIQAAYEDLKADMEAYARIAANKKEYFPLIESMNGLIEDYNQAVQARIRGKKDGEDIIANVE